MRSPRPTLLWACGGRAMRETMNVICLHREGTTESAAWVVAALRLAPSPSGTLGGCCLAHMPRGTAPRAHQSRSPRAPERRSPDSSSLRNPAVVGLRPQRVQEPALLISSPVSAAACCFLLALAACCCSCLLLLLPPTTLPPPPLHASITPQTDFNTLSNTGQPTSGASWRAHTVGPIIMKRSKRGRAGSLLVL